MADIRMTNTINPLAPDSSVTHTHIDLCTPCVDTFMSREDATTISITHGSLNALPTFRCAICRHPAKRWTVETANNA